MGAVSGARQVDAVVIGMGPGGEEVAGRLADAGLDVVGVDEALLGGECPYWACIPTKIMVRGAGLLAEGRRIPGMAGHAMVHEEWPPVARHIREATDDWDDKVAVDRFTSRGGAFLRGQGRLTAPDEVTVLGSDGVETVLRPRRAIVIAVGSQAAVPPVPGLAATPYWTNREAVAAEEVPESLLVLGGGPVGLEIAQAMSRFGSAATVVEAAPRLLGREEPEAGDLLLRTLTEDGLTVHTGQALEGVSYTPGTGFEAWCERGERLTAERLLVAAGRRVDLARVGAGVLGVDDTAHALPVDERLRVPGSGRDRRPGVWGVGDVTGKGAFTHMAMYQADVAVRAVLGQGGRPASYHAVPRVTFTDPEVGAVGMTEAQARQAGLPGIRVGATDLAASSRGYIQRVGNAGFIKLVASGEVLVGGTVAGAYAGEMLGQLSTAVSARVPLADLADTIWAFPTLHRAFGDALRALR
ncbi:dihydrolipoyl dehydrogenase family protein [Phaeacidiphilus oryzae]|uniref:dihydrolipoyl dehydrogenase family protein n=1 Tax=Phaeacidiphilus oryzae TaxID=348818 RepID=UPI000A520521|nr:NAD(P)/FAD-dependent oxidoreductase [Phaeacidiphilus oryzae]